MPVNCRLRPRGWQLQRGISLPELLLTAATFLLLSSIALTLNRTATEREELNAVAIGLASWLEAVQQDAQRSVGGCQVTFTTGSDLAVGSELAKVQPLEPSGCQGKVDDPFRLGPEGLGNPIQIKITTNHTQSSLIFTPRGTVTLLNDMILVVRQSNGTLTRCLRISGTSGMVAVGANNDASDLCPVKEGFDTFRDSL